MKKEMVILKFGGSLITDKASNVPRTNNSKLKAISKILNQNKVINVSKDKIQNNRETSNKIIDDNKDKQNQNGGEKK